METVRWGLIGCGDVAEVKSGPALYKAEGSALVAVMRRDRTKAEDYARRHNVSRAHTRTEDLIEDPEVDVVYIATPPSSHCDIALKVAAAGKPCLVEKPMAMNHAECLQMVQAFRAADRSNPTALCALRAPRPASYGACAVQRIRSASSLSARAQTVPEAARLLGATAPAFAAPPVLTRPRIRRRRGRFRAGASSWRLLLRFTVYRRPFTVNGPR